MAKLGLVAQDPSGQVRYPVDVIAMGVGEDHLGDVAGLKTHLGHCARKLLLACHFHACERHVPRRCALAGVDQPQHPLMLDRPAVDRKGSDHAPGTNRSSCLRAPLAGKRKLCLTRTLPV